MVSHGSIMALCVCGLMSASVCVCALLFCFVPVLSSHAGFPYDTPSVECIQIIDLFTYIAYSMYIGCMKHNGPHFSSC